MNYMDFVYCECGCQKTLRKRKDKNGLLRRFVQGHNSWKVKSTVNRVCVNCGSNTTYKKKDGKFHWLYVNGETWCKRCHNKEISNPITQPINNKKLLTFYGKQIHLKENPRTGKCSKCNRKIGDEYVNCFGELTKIKQTQMHHRSYDPMNPLNHTVELCASCHVKLSWNIRKSGTNLLIEDLE